MELGTPRKRYCSFLLAPGGLVGLHAGLASYSMRDRTAQRFTRRSSPTRRSTPSSASVPRAQTMRCSRGSMRSCCATRCTSFGWMPTAPRVYWKHTRRITAARPPPGRMNAAPAALSVSPPDTGLKSSRTKPIGSFWQKDSSGCSDCDRIARSPKCMSARSVRNPTAENALPARAGAGNYMNRTATDCCPLSAGPLQPGAAELSLIGRALDAAQLVTVPLLAVHRHLITHDGLREEADLQT